MRKPTEVPPHLETEWLALSESEQREVTRWFHHQRMWQEQQDRERLIRMNTGTTISMSSYNKCAHVYWKMTREGEEFCLTCGARMSDTDAMGL